jgi:hypothetical protein
MKRFLLLILLNTVLIGGAEAQEFKKSATSNLAIFWGLCEPLNEISNNLIPMFVPNGIKAVTTELWTTTMYFEERIKEEDGLFKSYYSTYNADGTIATIEFDVEVVKFYYNNNRVSKIARYNKNTGETIRTYAIADYDDIDSYSLYDFHSWANYGATFQRICVRNGYLYQDSYSIRIPEKEIRSRYTLRRWYESNGNWQKNVILSYKSQYGSSNGSPYKTYNLMGIAAEVSAATCLKSGFTTQEKSKGIIKVEYKTYY